MEEAAKGKFEALLRLFDRQGDSATRRKAEVVAAYRRRLDDQWSVLDAGEGLCALTGLDRDQLRARGLAPCLSPDALAACRAMIAATPSYRLEYCLRDPAGNELRVEDRGEVLDDFGGGGICLGVIRRMSETPDPAEMVDTIARAIDRAVLADGAWLWLQDSDLRFIHPEAAICKGLGLAGDEFVGKRRWEMALKEATAESIAAHKQLCEQQQPFHGFVYALRSQTGELRYLSESGEPLHDQRGELIGYLGIGRDITEQIRQENALRDFEQRTSCFADLAPGWFWEQDREYRFSRFWGVPPEEVLLSQQRVMGARRWDLPLLGVSAEQLAAHRACVERNMPFRDFEYMLRSVSGEEQWYSVSGRPVFDTHGAFAGYCGTGVRTNRQREMTRSLSRYRAIIEAANEVALGLTSEFAMERVLASIVQRAVGLADSDSGYLYLVSESADCLELSVATGIVEGFAGTRLAPGEGLSGIVWQTGEPLLVNDYQSWAWRSPQYREAGITAIAGVPLKLEQRVIGVIGVLRGTGVALEASVVESIAAFAPLAALTLQYARQQRELQLARSLAPGDSANAA